MSSSRSVAVTGGLGNLGTKLLLHLARNSLLPAADWAGRARTVVSTVADIAGRRPEHDRHDPGNRTARM